MTHRVLGNCFTLLVVSAGLLVSACSDDSSTSSENRESVAAQPTTYESVKALPKCKAGNDGEVLYVKDDLYACSDNAWVKVTLFANGVCNIKGCSDSLNEKYVYVKDSEKAYQCLDGEWTDVAGNLISRDEYLTCFMQSIIADTLESDGDLPKCSSKLQQTLVLVEDDIYACLNSKWNILTDQVVSEDDLPRCKKNGTFVFVMGKMASYECRDGVWYNGDKAVETAKSSSSEEDDDSIESSSSKAKDPLTTDDSTKVRGICMPTVKNAEKNGEVEWKFTNMGGTPVSYKWSFDESASETTSSQKRPVVTYAKAGVKKATLIVNKGLPSESDTLVCSDLAIIPTQVTGCECTTNKSGVSKVSAAMPDSAEWTVSNCSGGEPFAYEWSGPVTGAKNKQKLVMTTGGTFSPKVTVTNDEGAVMSVSCPSVTTKGILSVNCSITEDNEFFVDGYSWQNWSYSEMGSYYAYMTLAADDGFSTEIEVSDYGSQRFPLDESEYVGVRTYSLIYGKDTVCTASTVTCGPDVSSVEKGSSVSWGLSEMGEYTPKSYLWKFSDGSSSTKALPSQTFKSAGTVKATLLLDAGLETETQLTCSSVYVEPAPVTGCTCSSTLKSSSDDLAEVSPVKYQWIVDGCVSDVTEPLSYAWSAYEPDDVNTATGVFSEKGHFSPVVTVSNSDGAKQNVKCEVANVRDSNNPLEVIEQLGNNETVVLEGGSYYIEKCSETASGGVMDITGSGMGCQEWFQEYSNFSDFGLNECRGLIYITMPLYVDVPAGETLTIRNCF